MVSYVRVFQLCANSITILPFRAEGWEKMLGYSNGPVLLPSNSLERGFRPLSRAWTCSWNVISPSSSSEPLLGLACLLPTAQTTWFPQHLWSDDLSPSNALHPPLCLSTEPHSPSQLPFSTCSALPPSLSVHPLS